MTAYLYGQARKPDTLQIPSLERLEDGTLKYVEEDMVIKIGWLGLFPITPTMWRPSLCDDVCEPDPPFVGWLEQADCRNQAKDDKVNDGTQCGLSIIRGYLLYINSGICIQWKIKLDS